jgi:hypothetical protein
MEMYMAKTNVLPTTNQIHSLKINYLSEQDVKGLDIVAVR